MKQLAIAAMILVLSLGLTAQQMNVEETDFLDQGKRISAADFVVAGITIDTPLADVLKKFNKNDKNFEKNYQEIFELKLNSELEIESIDKTRIDAIIIKHDFKKIKGKVQQLLGLTDKHAFRKLLFDSWGKADKYDGSDGNIVSNEYYYKEGLQFHFFVSTFTKGSLSSIKIYSPRLYQKNTEKLKAPPWLPYQPTKLAEPIFRKAKWGMSRKEIIALEGKQPDYNKDNLLMFKDDLMGFSVFAVYLFSGDQFFTGKYGFVQKHSNKNMYLEDFDKIKGALIKKYGVPESDNKFWLKDLYKTDPQNWGMAVSVGHLVVEAAWHKTDVNILLKLSGDNYDILFVLQYSDPNFNNPEKDSEPELDKL